MGAILTQNTAWSNVEKAIANLKNENLLNFEKLFQTSDKIISQLIKPAGYFNIKTRRLRNFLNFVKNEFGSFENLFDLSTEKLREVLLSITGIGPETADSIVLYAFNRPTFVVDAYTQRVLVRHSLIDGEADYYRIKDFFESNLQTDQKFFNEYHALLVMIGKHYCAKSKPKCEKCPLNEVNGGPILDC